MSESRLAGSSACQWAGPTVDLKAALLDVSMAVWTGCLWVGHLASLMVVWWVVMSVQQRESMLVGLLVLQWAVAKDVPWVFRLGAMQAALWDE